jgi:hypothetical protein
VTLSPWCSELILLEAPGGTGRPGVGGSVGPQHAMPVRPSPHLLLFLWALDDCGDALHAAWVCGPAIAAAYAMMPAASIGVLVAGVAVVGGYDQANALTNPLTAEVLRWVPGLLETRTGPLNHCGVTHP